MTTEHYFTHQLDWECVRLCLAVELIVFTADNCQYRQSIHAHDAQSGK